MLITYKVLEKLSDIKNMRIGDIKSSFSLGCCVDSELKEIMRRLLAYGIQPTGNKSIDMQKLRSIEEQKAKTEGVASNKFYTISSSEMEKIVEKKKGASILGEYNKFLINQNKDNLKD